VYPSLGYQTRLGKGAVEVEDINMLLKETVEKMGIGIKKETTWFDLEPTDEPYRKAHPPCIAELLKGVKKGGYNDASMRLGGYFRKFKRYEWSYSVRKMREWNKRNDPPFSDVDLLQKLKDVDKYVGPSGYGCNDPILKSLCKGETNCPIGKLRLKVAARERVLRDPLEMVKDALQESRSIVLHPIIDYHPVVGYSIGLFISDNSLLQIINKKVEMLNIEGNPLELKSSTRISLEATSIKHISKRWKESILEISNDILNGKEIENKARKDVAISCLDKVKYYYYHSDERWFLFATCFIIATYYHRLFSVFGHWVLQGQRETGKTTMGLLLSQLCWNPTSLESHINPAPTYRRIEGTRCTHLADLTKVDYRDNDIIDLYEAIDPNFAVARCVGPEKDEVRSFYLFSPKAIMVRQTVPFSAKAIECLTEKASKGSPYTQRRKEISVDPDMQGIVESILRSVVCNWKDVYVAYKEMKQDIKLFGRRFELWQPFLSVCKVYFPDRYEDLLGLAYDEAERAEKGDVTSEVEDALIGYLLEYVEQGKKSQTFSLKDLTTELQEILGASVVKTYHIVKSSIKNLKISRKTIHTSAGVKYQIDLEKVKTVADERNVQKLEASEPEGERQLTDFCHLCGEDLHNEQPITDFDGSREVHVECRETFLKRVDSTLKEKAIETSQSSLTNYPKGITTERERRVYDHIKGALEHARARKNSS